MRFITILLFFLLGCSKPISKPGLENRQKLPKDSIIIRDELTPHDVKKIVHYLNNNKQLQGIESWLNQTTDADLKNIAAWLNRNLDKSSQLLDIHSKNRSFSKLKTELLNRKKNPSFTKEVQLLKFAIHHSDFYDLLENDFELLNPKLTAIVKDLLKNSTPFTEPFDYNLLLKELKPLFSNKNFISEFKTVLEQNKKSLFVDFIFSEFNGVSQSQLSNLENSVSQIPQIIKLLSLFENNSALLSKVLNEEKELFREFLVDMRPYLGKIFSSFFYQLYFKDFKEYKNDKKFYEQLFNAVQLNSQKQWENPFKNSLTKFEFYNNYNNYVFAMGIFKFLKATSTTDSAVVEMKLRVTSDDFKNIGLQNFADLFEAEKKYLPLLEVGIPEKSHKLNIKDKISYAIEQFDDKAHFLKKDIYNKIELAIDTLPISPTSFSADNFINFLSTFNLKSLESFKTLIFEDLSLASLDDTEKDRFIVFSEKLEERHPGISSFLKTFFDLIPSVEKFTALDFLQKILKASEPQRKTLAKTLLFLDRHSLFHLKTVQYFLKNPKSLTSFLFRLFNLREEDQNLLLNALTILSKNSLLDKHLLFLKDLFTSQEVVFTPFEINISEETFFTLKEIIQTPETKKIFEHIKTSGFSEVLKNIQKLSQSKDLENIFRLLGRIENNSIQRLSTLLVYFYQSKELEAFIDSIEILGGRNVSESDTIAHYP